MNQAPERDGVVDPTTVATSADMAPRTPAMTSEDDIAKMGQRARRRWRLKIWSARVGLLAVVLGGWELTARSQKPQDFSFYYGQPSLIWKALVSLFQNGSATGNIWTDIWATTQEALLGFALGTLVGVVLGVLLGSSPFLAETIGPYLKALNAIPRIVLGSIFFVAFGLGTFPKVLLAAVLVFFVVFFNAFQGVREVDPNVIANAKVLGASRLQIARHATLPSALTWIIASLHTAFGFAIVGALVQEILGAQHGVGLIIHNAQNNFDSETVFAGMVIIAVFTLVAETVITFIERRLLSWRPPSASGGASI
ncbi:MAG: ABC transporter permease [Marmoricola sp.]